VFPTVADDRKRGIVTTIRQVCVLSAVAMIAGAMVPPPAKGFAVTGARCA
jgi:hypothetical protein